jgi:hypothetical protein
MRLHLPSALIGGLFALFMGVLLAADRPAFYLGRFALEATESNVFVLDTETGRVWQKFVSGSSGQTDPDFAQPKVR